MKIDWKPLREIIEAKKRFVLTTHVRLAGDEPEYVFRSAISFAEMEPEQRDPLREFLQIQIARLKEKQDEAAAAQAT